MRILHVTQGYAPAIGGTERLIQRTAEELVRGFGDDAVVFTTNCYNGDAFYSPELPSLPVGWTEIGGVKVRRFPVRRRVSQALRGPQAIAYRLGIPFNQYLRVLAGGPIVPDLDEAIRREPADLVVAASFPLLHMFHALRAAHDSHRPCVLIGCLHPLDDWAAGRPMIYRAIREADAYVALTRYEADYVIERGASPSRVHVVGAGVDLSADAPTTSDEAKWRIGFDRRPLVGFVGQLAGHKGVDTLLRAMPRVWEVEPNVNLLVAGGRTLYAQEVERLIQSWPDDFRRRTRLWVGFPEPRKSSLFQAIDLLAYPSGYESFGIAYLEAWAEGKPVIGVRRGAVPSVIDHGVNGLLVDYQDDDALARGILELVRDPAKARALGQAGKVKVTAQFTWDRIAAELRRIYMGLSGR
jgi:glycosyltransferase involved in cell wall biosynthesis